MLKEDLTAIKRIFKISKDNFSDRDEAGLTESFAIEIAAFVAGRFPQNGTQRSTGKTLQPIESINATMGRTPPS